MELRHEGEVKAWVTVTSWASPVRHAKLITWDEDGLAGVRENKVRKRYIELGRLVCDGGDGDLSGTRDVEAALNSERGRRGEGDR